MLFQRSSIWLKIFLYRKFWALFSRNLSFNNAYQKKKRNIRNDAFWGIVIRWWFIGYLITGTFATASTFDFEPISKFCWLQNIYLTIFSQNAPMCSSFQLLHILQWQRVTNMKKGWRTKFLKKQTRQQQK